MQDPGDLQNPEAAQQSQRVIIIGAGERNCIHGKHAEKYTNELQVLLA